MTGDYCPQKQVLVTIQENGIIRGPSGRMLARLDPDIPYDSEHLDPIAADFKEQPTQDDPNEELTIKLLNHYHGMAVQARWPNEVDMERIIEICREHPISNEKEDIRKYKI